MKIVAIRLKNLASIEGSFEIDFRQEPLASAGIFAISGPTGSGKSTLLDALCLALFDKAPRFTATNEKITLIDVGEERIQQTDVRNILRRGTGEGYAEVEFIGVDGFRYCSRWTVYRARRKPGGALQAQLLKVMNKDADTELQGTKTELLSQLTRLVGLTYDQFTRTVLLAQNDFATFLKSRDDAKAELLEKLTGTDVYSRISMTVYARAKAAEGELRLITDQMQGIELLSDEEMELLQEERTQRNKEREENSIQLFLLTRKLKWLEQKAQLTVYQEQAAQLLKQTEESLKQAQPRFEFVNRIDSVQSARPLLNEERSLAQKIDSQQALFEKVKEEFTLCTKNKMLAEALKVNNETLLKNKQDEICILEVELKKARALDVQLAGAEQNLRQAENARKEALLYLTSCEHEHQVHTTALQAASKQLTILEEWLQKYSAHSTMIAKSDWIIDLLSSAAIAKERLTSTERELKKRTELRQQTNERQKLDQKHLDEVKGKLYSVREQSELLRKKMEVIDTDALRKERNELTLRKERLSAVLTAEIELNASREERAKLLEKQTKVRTSLTENSSLLSLKSSELLLLGKEKETVLRLYDNAKLATADNVVGLRQGLLPNEPCPVCGSLHHPHQEEELQVNALLQTLETDYREVALRFEKLSNECVSLSRDVQHAEIDWKELEKEIKLRQAISREKEQNREQCLLLLDEVLAHLTCELSYDSLMVQTKARLEAIAEAEQGYESLRVRYTRVNQQVTLLSEQLETGSRNLEKLTREDQLFVTDLEVLKGGRESNALLLQETLDRLNKEMTIENWEELWSQDHNHFKEQIKKLVELWREKSHQQTELTLSLQKLTSDAEGSYKLISNATEREQQALNLYQHASALLARGREERAGIIGGQLADEVERTSNRSLEQAKQKVEDDLREVNKLSAHCAGLEGEIRQLTASVDQLLTDRSLAQKRLDEWLENAAKSTTSSWLTRQELGELLDVTAYWLLEERTFLTRFQEERTSALATWKERSEQLQRHFQSKDCPESETETSESLEKRVSLLTANQKEIDACLATVDARLKMQELNKLHLKSFEKELAAKKQMSERWAKLNDLIGQASGEKFKIIAQSYTLGVLLQHANQHLGYLSHRYKLQQVPGSLGLQVIDRDMCDEIRTVYSLSGGESFLISLALALGLSSLSSNNMKVESLFIDEGFGSLDADSLRMAMEALEQLQTQGRKIGVISHVQEMGERISTQILISRQINGKSKISVVG